MWGEKAHLKDIHSGRDVAGRRSCVSRGKACAAVREFLQVRPEGTVLLWTIDWQLHRPVL